MAKRADWKVYHMMGIDTQGRRECLCEKHKTTSIVCK